MIAVVPPTKSSFPYDNPVVGIAYTSLTIELANALDAIGTQYFPARATDYVAARRTFKGLLRRDDFQHFELHAQQPQPPALPVAFLMRQLLSASLRQDRESAVKILGVGEAFLNDHISSISQAVSA